MHHNTQETIGMLTAVFIVITMLALVLWGWAVVAIGVDRQAADLKRCEELLTGSPARQ